MSLKVRLIDRVSPDRIGGETGAHSSLTLAREACVPSNHSPWLERH